MTKVISTSKAPAAIGPYSQAIQVGNLMFVSGQLAIDPKTGTIVESHIVGQTKQVMKNIESILEEAKAGLDNIVKTTIFIKDMEQFPAVNEVYASFLSKHFPARSTVEVSRLPKDALIEIEVIANID